MTVLKVSQETLIMLPDGATGGSVKITYNGTTVGSVIASGDDQGQAVITSGRLAKLTGIDGASPLQIVGRESGGRRPSPVTIRIYPIYPPNVLGPVEPITLTGLPVGSPDAPGVWDLSNIEDSSGGLDVVTAAERQTIAELKGATEQAVQNAVAAAQSVGSTLAEVTRTTEEMRSVAGIYNLGREPQAGDLAGTYRVITADGAFDIAWNGQEVTGRTPALATSQQAQTTQSAIANTALAGLTAKGKADSLVQFCDGSRWLWQASGTPDGGTVVSASDNGVWIREITDGKLRAKWFGVQGDGSDESALIQSIFERARGTGYRLSWHRPQRFFNCGDRGVKVTGVGDDYTVEIHPAAQFRATSQNAESVLTFADVGDGFSLHGGVFGWTTQPTARGGAAAVYINGVQITNIVVEDFRVENSRNFAIWIRAMAASGSHTVRVSGVMSANTLGDGVHVENFDHSIAVHAVQVQNSGDDAVAITQYTGNSSSDDATHYPPARNVVISDIISENPTLAVVKLQGVVQAAVSNITATGGAASADAILLQMASGTGYNIPNADIALSNCATSGLRALFALASTSRSADIGGHGHYRLTNLIGTNLSGDAVFLSGQALANGDLGTIVLDGIDVTASGKNTAGRSLYASQVAGLQVRNFRGTGFGGTATIANCGDVQLAGIEDTNPSTARDGILIDRNKRVRYERLVARDIQATPLLKRGLIIINNSDLRGRGGCEVVGNSQSAVSWGGNSNIGGYLDEVEGVASLGNVGGGSSSTVTYARPVLAGGAVTGQITVEGDPSGRWVARNLAANQTEVVFGDAINGAKVHYLVRGILMA